MLVIMLVGKTLMVGFYVFFYIKIIHNNRSLHEETSQIVYNNLIAGEVTKQVSLLNSLQQMQAGQYFEPVQDFLRTYNDNINYLSAIYARGGP